MPSTPCLQAQYTPQSICFGCGPINPHGLQLQSFVDGDSLIAVWHPQDHHQAYENMINGGIISTLLDCHSAWAAAWSIHAQDPQDQLPVTVTAQYTVRFRRPTPCTPLYLFARAQLLTKRKAQVEAYIKANNKMSASSQGVFVAVGSKHPAYHSQNNPACHNKYSD